MSLLRQGPTGTVAVPREAGSEAVAPAPSFRNGLLYRAGQVHATTTAIRSKLTRNGIVRFRDVE